MWLAFAMGSALFAGMTAILSKQGIRHLDSSLATALRTLVVLAFSWLMVFVVGAQKGLSDIGPQTLLFLVLSGLATGGSWLCYFKALQLGTVSKVTPIDKSSTVLTMLLAIVFLGEPLTGFKAVAMVLIGAGTWLMIDPGKAPVSAGTAATESPAALASPVSAGTASQKTSATAESPAAAGSASLGADPHLRAGTRRFVRDAAWLPYAVGAAVFAALTSILGKIGIQGIDSTLGTAIRTAVVLVMAWLVVLAGGRRMSWKALDRRDLWFLVLSGVATGGSWLCYYRALQDGPASVVVPIDKLSIVLTIAFSRVFLKERQSRRALGGLAMIVAGTLTLLVR